MKQGGKVWVDFKTPRLTTHCNLKCAASQILILGTTLALVFLVFDINLIWHPPVAANLIQVFSHFINAEARSHFRVLYSWISTGTLI